MTYIKIKDRNLKFVEVTFLAKNINVTKKVREDRVENFRQDMLAKYDLLFKKEPHMIRTV